MKKTKDKIVKNKRLMGYKDYAGRYDISTINPDYKPGTVGYHRNVNSILNDIYKYERVNRPVNALYPFFSS